MTEPIEHRIAVTSGFGVNTRKPFVQVEIPETGTCPVMRRGAEGHEPAPGLIGLQLAPDEARSLALNLLEAAEASLGDGFLLTFLERELEMPIEDLTPLLVKFRGYRIGQDPEGT